MFDRKRAAAIALEGLRVAIATVIVYFVILMAYYIFMRQPDQVATPASMMWLAKAFALALAYQILYTYMGFNKTDKQLRRVTLEKDALRCLTIINEEYARVSAAARTGQVQQNAAILLSAALNADFIADLAAADGMCDDNIIIKYSGDITDEQRKLLCGLPRDVIFALPPILRAVDRDVMFDVIMNGFTNYAADEPFDTIPLSTIAHAKQFSLKHLKLDLQSQSEIDMIVDYDGKSALIARIEELEAAISNDDGANGKDKNNKNKIINGGGNDNIEKYDLANFKYNPNLRDVARRMNKYLPKNDISITEMQETLDSLNVFDNIKFHRCWAAEHLPYWYTKLRPLAQSVFSGRAAPIKYLQIGVFEGMSLLYLNKVVLDGFQTEITVIDNFSTEQYFKTEQTFDSNTKDLNIVNKIKKLSHDALRELVAANDKFDFVYCSGARKPDICFVDFAWLSQIMAPSGILLLDAYDIQWASYDGDISPNIVRDTFIDAFKLHIITTDIGRQRAIQFLPEVPQKWQIKEKAPDCVNYGMQNRTM